MRETLRQMGIRPGRLEAGPANDLTDVAGTRVGHLTKISGEGSLRVGQGPVRTGITVVVPPEGGPWPAGTAVINGYGKSLGLIQVQELGTIEAPVYLTNTLSVGAVQQGALRHHRDHGTIRPGQSLNVVVGECNDGFLNDLWGLHVTPDDVESLWDNGFAGDAEGSVGAGTGMQGFGYKGGVGMSSRRLSTGAVLGALVLLNCGRPADLGVPEPVVPPPTRPDGSIMILLTGNLALDRFDSGRVVRRAVHGLARTGATSAPGSGDVALYWDVGRDEGAKPDLAEAFLAVTEATEEAIWNALATAETIEGRDGHVLPQLGQDQIRGWWLRSPH